MPEDNGIIIAADGLPRARTVAEFNRMDSQTQAALLAGYQGTVMGGSAASSIIIRRMAPEPESPKPFDSDDRTIRDNWQPSAEQIIGTTQNQWK